MLIDAQDELARAKAMAAIGEIAAGAAHEMNNPLAVISGRSQVLVQRLTDPELKGMAEQIVRRSHQLSDMITALRSFADPTPPDLKPCDVAGLMRRVVEEAAPKADLKSRIKVLADANLPQLHIDSDQIGRAVRELLKNALEAAPPP